MTRCYRTNRTMKARINRGSGHTRRNIEVNAARSIIQLVLLPITAPFMLIGW